MRLLTEATVLLDGCLAVDSSDDVVVICDDYTSNDLVNALTAVAQTRGRSMTLVRHTPGRIFPLSSYCQFALGSLRSVPLAPSVREAMRAASAVVFASSDLEAMFSADFLEIANGRRSLFAPYLVTEGAERMLPKSIEEAQELEQLVDRVGHVMREASSATIVSGEGAELTMTLGRWSVREHRGIVGEKGVQLVPAGQVTHIPNPESANGRVVIDRSIADGAYRQLIEPLVLDVERGQVVGIAGGHEGDQTSMFLAGFKDSRVFNLTELGIGLNSRCTLTGVGAPTEDTHRLGTVSLAMGCDVHIGGGTPAPVHVDMTMWNPTLLLDDKVAVDKGELKL